MGLGLQRRIKFGFVAALEGLGGSGNLNASLGYSVQGSQLGHTWRFHTQVGFKLVGSEFLFSPTEQGHQGGVVFDG